MLWIQACSLLCYKLPWTILYSLSFRTFEKQKNWFYTCHDFRVSSRLTYDWHLTSIIYDHHGRQNCCFCFAAGSRSVKERSYEQLSSLRIMAANDSLDSKNMLKMFWNHALTILREVIWVKEWQRRHWHDLSRAKSVSSPFMSPRTIAVALSWRRYSYHFPWHFVNDFSSVNRRLAAFKAHSHVCRELWVIWKNRTCPLH